MTKTKLQLTEFQIEKLKNVVNVGQSSAYQILTSPGNLLGTMGHVADSQLMTSVNNDRFEQVNVATSRRRQSWIKKVLRSLR